MRILSWLETRRFVASQELWARTSEPFTLDGGPQGGPFLDVLKDFYRFEYTYSMLRQKPFKGNETRKQSILKRVEFSLREVTEEIRIVLSHVFQEWLRHHAITNPSEWARDRVSGFWEEGVSETYRDLIWEYIKYEYEDDYRRSTTPEAHAKLTRRAERDFMKNHVVLHGLKQALDWDTLVEEKVSYEMEEFDSDPEEIRDRRSIPEEVADREEVEEFLRAEFQESADIEDFLPEGIESALNSAEDLDSVERFLIEFGSELVFPAWYRYWGAQGIDTTRNRIETLAKQLQEPTQDLGRQYATVNAALNASHQTGSMLEHIAEVTEDVPEDLQGVLDSLTEGAFTAEIDPILKKAGVVL